MLRRMDSEEKRRNDAELAAAEAKAKAEAASASAPSDPFVAATSASFCRDMELATLQTQRSGNLRLACAGIPPSVFEKGSQVVTHRDQQTRGTQQNQTQATPKKDADHALHSQSWTQPGGEPAPGSN